MGLAFFHPLFKVHVFESWFLPSIFFYFFVISCMKITKFRTIVIILPLVAGKVNYKYLCHGEKSVG